MDWILPIVNFVLGLGVIAFVFKYIGQAKKYLGVAKEALDLLNAIVKAIEDKEVTKSEIALIKEEVDQLMDALK